MQLIDKVRKHGIRESINILHSKINDRLVCFFNVLPFDENLIVLESEGDLSDNAYALYEYMKTGGYLKKYKVVWLVNDLKKAPKYHINNTVFVEKYPKKISIKRDKLLGTCRWYIYDHCNVLPNIKRSPQKITAYLCHGFAGFKAPKGVDLSIPNFDDYLFVTGEIPKELVALCRNVNNTKVEELGFSRIDYFFLHNQDIRACVQKHIDINNYKKIFLWMPTFRESNSKSLSEEYQHKEIHLPLIDSITLIEQLNDYLKNNNDLIVLKIHHLQKSLSIFQKHYSNILFISDEDIHDWGIQLYQFIPCTDALITDYSSISADYMILDKPMVFILDDYEEYKKSRGIIPENACDLMKGDHVYSYEQLIEALDRIHNGMDIYKMERRLMVPRFHKYQDHMASKRILDYLGIKV